MSRLFPLISKTVLNLFCLVSLCLFSFFSFAYILYVPVECPKPTFVNKVSTQTEARTEQKNKASNQKPCLAYHLRELEVCVFRHGDSTFSIPIAQT